MLKCELIITIITIYELTYENGPLQSLSWDMISPNVCCMRRCLILLCVSMFSSILANLTFTNSNLFDKFQIIQFEEVTKCFSKMIRVESVAFLKWF